ncbi:MAG: rod shape-determining protein MreC [Nonomuraea sp.]|nr:rod shape-determining protein MreC [Nonomuraea sp.]NUP77861.1 rod shape-determining protein MreC [Nonomuraea sp.]NUT40279.1 rod shape-determining protein MreC [Thermoactinospora sp.]
MRRAFRASVLILLAAGAALVVIDRVVTPLTPLRAAGSTLYGTAENAIGTLTRSFGAEGRARALERENARLRADLLSAGWKGQTSDQLDRLAARTANHRGVAAHVVGFGRGRNVTIDAGAGDGVERDVTVLNADGLVGKVTWAGPVTASVSLITDATSSVGARMVGSGELGVVRGQGDGLRLSLFDPNAPLKAGDQVVTLGSAGGRPYAAGLPIGTVTKIETVPGAATRTALLRPAAQLSALDLVAVLVPASGR